MKYDVIIVGGGAAGFFAAIQIASAKPGVKICILERGTEVLSKVRVSGGGRCNVTHAEFIPGELAKNYPRGDKELRGPFHTFASGDTMAFFEERGVSLKIENDGRIFPTSDSSQTIIDCFLRETVRLGIEVRTGYALQKLVKETNFWVLHTSKGEFTAEKVLLATGSNPKIWEILKNLGHTVVAPVPSLFTFNIKDLRITDLMGLSTMAEVSLLNTNGTPLKALSVKGNTLEKTSGPLLITHWGMSGPAILKLSAWAARELHEVNYKFKIKINWLYPKTGSETEKELYQQKNSEPKKQILNSNPFDIPKRLWMKLVIAAGITEQLRWAEISGIQIQALLQELTAGIFEVNGKSTFKEEFVTAGGVDLKEINFKTFQSKLYPNLYFAGEILNIDAITGGFNFQNAWTGAYIAAQHITA